MKAVKKSDVAAFNILSYIRVRPLNEKEKKTQHLEFRRSEVIVKNSSKVLGFDKVFDEESKQVAVYNTVVHPMIREVLQGYNCTVFAYGQTGTGKTYTMTGHQGDSEGSLVDNVHAGIIPRAMEEIFKELLMIRSEYQVSVQYIELYNEKLRSLLSDTTDENVQLINDMEGGVFVKGVPPTPVKNKDEAFKLLLQGAERRQMAATCLNENSSRSHTIFIIIVKIRESMPNEKEDILRVGKLYLVDLAGSENVSKSGANDATHKTLNGVNRRLAEASNINKSLLTLGRVITALTENNSHIPYRESKLTRILGDSLGGRTKTAIIGTISPSHANIDETESTLNYACKARNIKNKPQKNQTISKKEFMQFASEEILKLKRDLEATRQGDGFYISKESHEDMCNNMRSLEAQVKDWNDRYEKLNASYSEKTNMFESLSTDYDEKCAEYEELDQIFKMECEKFKDKLKEVEKQITFRECLIKEYEKTESNLTQQAKQCKSVLENLVDQSGQLHDKIDRTMKNENFNLQTLDSFKANLKNELKNRTRDMEELHKKESQLSNDLSKLAEKALDTMYKKVDFLLKVCMDFQDNLEKQCDATKVAQENVISSVEDKLSSSRALLQESVATQRALISSLLTDSIKQSFSEISETILNIKQFLFESSQNLNQTKKFQDELMIEAGTVREKWVNSINDIVGSFSKLKDVIEESLSKSKENSSNEKLMIQEALESIEILQSLKIRAEKVLLLQRSCHQNTIKLGDNMTDCLENTKQIETKLKDNSKTLESAHSKNVEKIIQVTDENHESQERMFSQAIAQFDCFAVKKEEVMQCLTSNVEKHITVLDEVSQKQDTDCVALSQHLVQQMNGFVTETKSSLESSSSFADMIKVEMGKNKDDMTDLLRDQHSCTQQYVNTVNNNASSLSSSLNKLANVVDTFNYNQYVSLGHTPQRLTKKDLNYPERFSSTAPRDVLIQKFRNVLEDNDDLCSSVPTIEVVETEKTPLRQLRNVNQIMKPSRVNSTPRHKNSNKLRRSISVPDLSEPTEDKENRRFTMYGKTKIKREK